MSSNSPASPLLTSVTGPFFTSSATGAASTGSSASAPSSSSLYLYTFLATLVLLLGISAAIVVRSFVLRRRHQGIIEEAIRNGTWTAPTFGGMGRGRRDVGEKPRMWEAWIGEDRKLLGSERDIQKGYDEIEPEPGWDEILPISATYLNPPPPSNTTPVSPIIGRGHRPILPWRQRPYASASPSIPSSVLSLPAGARAATSSFSPPPPPLPIPIPGSPSSTPVLSPPTPDSSSDPVPPLPPNPMLRLTLLIAMPSPPSMRHTRDDDEEEPPVVEFGLIDVDVRSSSPGAGGPSNDRVPGSGGGVGVGSDRGDEAGI